MAKFSLDDYKPHEAFKIIREWSGESQENIGKLIGKKVRTIQDYEAGTYGYNILSLKKICDEYGIKIIFEKK